MARSPSVPSASNRPVLVLVNVSSGSAEQERVDEVCRALADQEYAAVVASAVDRDVIVVGGDGSVHRLLQELTDQQLLDRVAAEATAHAAGAKGVLGRAAYLWGAVRAGLTRKAWHLRVVVDGHTIVDSSGRVLMVSAALGSSVGGGALVAPQARQDDGLVDVLVACGTCPWSRVGFARDLRRARHVERDDAISARGRQVLVEAASARDAFRVNADGDVSDGREVRRRWELLEGVWQLRVPHSTPRPP